MFRHRPLFIEDPSDVEDNVEHDDNEDSGMHNNTLSPPGGIPTVVLHVPREPVSRRHTGEDVDSRPSDDDLGHAPSRTTTDLETRPPTTVLQDRTSEEQGSDDAGV